MNKLFTPVFLPVFCHNLCIVVDFRAKCIFSMKIVFLCWGGQKGEKRSRRMGRWGVNPERSTDGEWVMWLVRGVAGRDLDWAQYEPLDRSYPRHWAFIYYYLKKPTAKKKCHWCEEILCSDLIKPVFKMALIQIIPRQNSVCLNSTYSKKYRVNLVSLILRRFK